MPALILRTVTALALLVLGAVVAVADVAVHRLGPGDWGWWLAAASALGVTLGAPPGLRRMAFVSGWVLAVAVVLAGRPEGDYALAGDVRGYGLLALAVVLVGMGAFTTPRGAATDTGRAADRQGSANLR